MMINLGMIIDSDDWFIERSDLDRICFTTDELREFAVAAKADVDTVILDHDDFTRLVQNVLLLLFTAETQSIDFDRYRQICLN